MTNEFKNQARSTVWLVKIVNIISYFICRLVLMVNRVQVRVDPSIFNYRKSPGQGLIIISNHKAISDPWLLCAALPLKTFFNVMPIRIMGASDFADPVANFFNKLGIVKIVYYLYGVMSFRRTWTFEEKLAPFISCLKQGGTILIFPEGYLNHQPGVEIFKQGIIYIYHSVEADILPVAINKEGSTTRVSLGQITRLPESVVISEDPHDTVPRQSCEYLRQRVLNLYN